MNHEQVSVDRSCREWLWDICGKNTLLGTKSWYFEEEGRNEKEALVLATKVLKDDIIAKVFNHEADIYEVFSILSHDSSNIPEMEPLKGLGPAKRCRIVGTYLWDLCLLFINIHRSAISRCPVIFLKCWICAILQMAVAPLVVAYEINNLVNRPVDGQPFQHCQMHEDDFMGKAVAFVFSLYILVLFLKGSGDMNDSKNAATYLLFFRNRVQESLGASFVWGYSANILLEFFTASVSLALIYLSPTPVEMLLNSLAMIFLKELDDALVTNREYREAGEVLEQLGWIKPDQEDEPEVKSLVHRKSVELVVSDGEPGTEILDEELIQDDLIPISNWFYPFKWCISALSMVVFLQVIFGPFYLAACYGSRGKGDIF